MTKTRYNAKIQRAKGLLEIAAAMYETSLSFQSANDEEAPFNVPLHPGARRFYRERGYLK